VGVGTNGPQAKIEASGTLTANAALRATNLGDPGIGVEAEAPNGIGVLSRGTKQGMVGLLRPDLPPCPGSFAVGGCAFDTGGIGVLGSTDKAFGLLGFSDTGVFGFSAAHGVAGALG